MRGHFQSRTLERCEFVIRDFQGEVKARRLQVFHALFYGKLAETNDSVKISDCDYKSQLELFRFMYNDEATKANLNAKNVMNCCM